MKRKHFSLLALLLSASIILCGCKDFDFPSASVNSKSEINIAISSSVGEQENSDTETTEENTDTSTDRQTEPIVTSEADTTDSAQTETEPVLEDYTDEMTVHFIDVDQGDSTFIELPDGKSMLIDAGETEQGDKVVTYIQSQGYDKINYLVATHAHSDHIGGMSAVLNSFNIDNFYFTSAETSTQIYNNLLNAVDKSGAEVHSVMAGDIIFDNANLLAEVVAPKEIDNDEQNNNSIVIKLTYGNNKFLFAGDAEKSEEDGIWTNIKCDVLKVGHHGSDSSTTANFLKKVEPNYAVISCGLYNSYGHPTDKVLQRLDNNNIEIFRTDKQGSIVFTCDGNAITINNSPYEYTPPVVTESTTPVAATTTATPIATTVKQTEETPPTVNDTGTTYVLNTNTKKIHYSYCGSVKTMKESNKQYTDDYSGAIASGYVPCKKCNP